MKAMRQSSGGYRLRTHLNTLVIGLVLTAGLAIGGFAYWQARALALESAEDSFQQLGNETATAMEALLLPVESVIGVLAGGQLPKQQTLESRLPFVPALAGALRRNPRLAAVYVGYDDGDASVTKHDVIEPIPCHGAARQAHTMNGKCRVGDIPLRQ